VSRTDSDRSAGAAANTTGNIITHETSHDSSQLCTKPPALMNGKLAIAAAITQVKPDCSTPKTK
jgi:hypothetical protein